MSDTRAMCHWWGKGFSSRLWRLCGPGKCGKDCPKHFSWKACALSHSWSAVKLHSIRSQASVTLLLSEIASAQDDFHRVCALTRRLFWNCTKPSSSAGLQGFLQGGRVRKKPLGWGDEAEAGSRDGICGHNTACSSVCFHWGHGCGKLGFSELLPSWSVCKKLLLCTAKGLRV